MTTRTWTIKGVSDRTRDAVYEATRAEGLTVGEWIDRALARAAEETLHPSPPAVTRDDMAEVVRELLDERLAPLTERVDRAKGHSGGWSVAGCGGAGAPTSPARALEAACGGGVVPDRFAVRVNRTRRLALGQALVYAAEAAPFPVLCAS